MRDLIAAILICQIAAAWLPAAPSARAQASEASGREPTILPTPKSLKLTGGNLRIEPSNRILHDEASLAPLAQVLADDIDRIHGVKLPAAEDRTGRKGDIVLRLARQSPQFGGPDGYRVLAGEQVVVEGQDYNAVAFGMMTVLQALRRDGAGLTIPRMNVLDFAGREFRALQVDIKSGYHPPQWVKTATDLARFYKVRLLELHTAESMWIGCTLASSNDVPQEVRKRNLLWTKKEMDDVLAYGRQRGVLLLPHNESTPRFAGMRKALTSDFHAADQFAGYMDEVDGKGPYAAKDDIPDEADDRFWSFLKVVTQRSYDQFAAGWPGGVLPYYHMGPVRAEGGTSPANAVRILRFLQERNPRIKLMYWCGPRADDPALAPHRQNVVVAFYSERWGGSPAALVQNGYEVINASWMPLYILPGTRHKAIRQGKRIFDEFQLYRFGDESGKVVDCSPWKDKVVGSMLPTWEFPSPQHREGHLEMILPCIPYYAEHAWNVLPYPYSEDNWKKVCEAVRELQPLALQLLRERRVCGAPRGVTATRGVYGDAVDVLWAEADNYPESYQVFRAENSDPARAQPVSGKIDGAFATKLNHFLDRSVQPGKRYTYWVKAGNPYGLSALSQPAEGQTGEGIAPPRAYEPFDYAADAPVGGLAGGTGWKTPWQVKEANGPMKINRTGLTYPGLRTSGRSLRLAPVDADEANRRRPPHILAVRTLDHEYGQEGTRIWTSFLVRAEKVRAGDLFVNIGRTGVGKGWGSRLCVYADANKPMEPDKTYLIVVRYVFHRGNDLIHMWIDAEPGKQPTDDDADVITRAYDNPQSDTFTVGMQPYGLGAYDVDELRVGATYEEVAPSDDPRTDQRP